MAIVAGARLIQREQEREALRWRMKRIASAFQITRFVGPDFEFERIQGCVMCSPPTF
jgi:hypothetical protein